MTPLSHIRNFAIIAHIDHGKSTLADRLIQACGGLEAREMREQVLDTMEIERERGITIKAQTVRLEYRARDGETYVLNLMDTPGHVDFAYEVSRSLAACEGSLLVVDASQGVEAQTLANVYQAVAAGHEIVPVLNKIDLPAAEPDRVKEQIEDVIGLDAVGRAADLGQDRAQHRGGARGAGDPPAAAAGRRRGAAQGAAGRQLVRPLSRRRDPGAGQGRRAARRAEDPADGDRRGASGRAGRRLHPERASRSPALGPGEIGFITAGIKTVADCRVGDTITEDRRPAAEPLPGFKPVQPVVFCGLFPTDAADYERLRDSLAKLRLNDASFEYEPETSVALGFGFRCGFLGLLHLEIIQERLAREFDLDLITTAPSVVYRVHLTNGRVRTLHNPADMPDPVRIDHIEEPWIKATILVPDAYLGPILALCEERRGVQARPDLCRQPGDAGLSPAVERGRVRFLRPAEIGQPRLCQLRLPARRLREGDLVLMNILVNGEPVDALSIIVHRSQAERRGRALCERLKDLIPRQLFQVAIQAAIGGRIIARETVKALRKDVLAKCYGGDVTRKRKLLEKQKEGKKRMRQFGKVEIPQSAFIAALKMGDG